MDLQESTKKYTEIHKICRYSRSPSPHVSVFKRLKKYRSPSPRLRPRKEGGVFNRLGRKEPATSARSDSRHRSPQAKRTEVEAKRRQQKGTPSRTTSQYSESEDSEGGHWKTLKFINNGGKVEEDEKRNSRARIGYLYPWYI
ncbi:hypothetical protein Tco_0548669 [Tanacetum coccineum]